MQSHTSTDYHYNRDNRLNAIDEVMESLNIEDTKESTHSLKTYYKLKRSDKQE